MRAVAPLTADERVAFVSRARTLLGAKFRHQGRNERGVDCAGVIAYALSAIGRTFVDAGAYGREPNGGRLEALLRENFGDPLPKDQMRAGDVALMKFRGPQPRHVGIITDYPHGGFALLHSFAQMKEVVEHRIDAEWFDAIVEVYR